eukprot:comp5518_c0_seq1/m.4847 comp5518_c0_seq1/g.4847  ORF comp5518_c0_seq1/g.4847 comp5518_c0_seq1/m.4847 type:complete len:483 (+) comp5518_c0_seq1:251-1699(+)
MQVACAIQKLCRSARVGLVPLAIRDICDGIVLGARNRLPRDPDVLRGDVDLGRSRKARHKPICGLEQQMQPVLLAAQRKHGVALRAVLEREQRTRRRSKEHNLLDRDGIFTEIGNQRLNREPGRNVENNHPLVAARDQLGERMMLLDLVLRRLWDRHNRHTFPLLLRGTLQLLVQMRELPPQPVELLQRALGLRAVLVARTLHLGDLGGQLVIVLAQLFNIMHRPFHGLVGLEQGVFHRALLHIVLSNRLFQLLHLELEIHILGDRNIGRIVGPVARRKRLLEPHIKIFFFVQSLAVELLGLCGFVLGLCCARKSRGLLVAQLIQFVADLGFLFPLVDVHTHLARDGLLALLQQRHKPHILKPQRLFLVRGALQRLIAVAHAQVRLCGLVHGLGDLVLEPRDHLQQLGLAPPPLALVLRELLAGVLDLQHETVDLGLVALDAVLQHNVACAQLLLVVVDRRVLAWPAHIRHKLAVHRGILQR